MSTDVGAVPDGPVRLNLTIAVEAVVHRTEGGELRAEVPALPAMAVTGADLSAIEAKLAEALEDWLEALDEGDLMAEAEAITPRKHELRALMARGLKPVGWCDSEEPLF
jgi:predicted RNase H-like HicB family nuclease